MSLFRVTLLLAASPIGIASQVQAQSTEAGASASQETVSTEEASPQGLEEIVVTARKISENLQDTPIAVSAMTESMIADQHPQDLTDLAGIAPNVRLQEVYGFGRTSGTTIRGIGTTDPETTFDPAVGVIVQGVFLNQAQGQLIDVFDVSRVEVLRGPQGTLFGKNTTGGIVNVVYKRPTDRFGVEAMTRIGNYDRFDVRAAINVPIVPGVLASRISAYRMKRDGFNFDRTSGKNRDSEKVVGIRAVTEFKPTDNINWLFTADYSHDTSGPAAGQNISTPAFSVCGFRGRCNDNQPRSQDYSVQQRIDIKSLLLANEINVEIGNNHTLTSVTGYRHLKDFVPLDLDATDLIYTDVYRRQRSRQFTQELRITRQPGESPLDYVLGVYYFNFDFRSQQDIFLNETPLAGFIPLLRQTPTRSGPHQKTQSYAAFAQANYQISDQLRVTAGLRYTHEKKDFETDLQFELDPVSLNQELQSLLTGTAVPPDIRRKVSFKSLTPRLGADYHFNDDLMVYGSWTRGFRSGGFNGRASSIFATLPYDDEKVDAFEVGFKGDFLDRRLRVNAAAFHTLYNDMQRDIRVAGPSGLPETIIANVGKAKLTGAELEITALPISRLRLDASLGYINARYTEFCANVGRTVPRPACNSANPAATDNTDLRLKSVPEWTWRTAFTYTVPLGSAGSLDINGEYQHESSSFEETLNAPNSKRKPTDIFDASLTFSDASERYRVSLWGRNLTNERFLSTFLNVGNFASLAYYNAPRTYGVDISFKF